MILPASINDKLESLQNKWFISYIKEERPDMFIWYVCTIIDSDWNRKDQLDIGLQVFGRWFYYKPNETSIERIIELIEAAEKYIISEERKFLDSKPNRWLH
jgi:hypothetical protein